MVASPHHMEHASASTREMHRIFDAQREAFAADPYPALSVRRDGLDRLAASVLKHSHDLTHALTADFGNRSSAETLSAEIMVTLEAIRYVKRRLKRWMRPSRRSISLLMKTTSARVSYQPKGVVGVISPWNYPIFMATGPLIYALAAGNRVMIKPSEFTPRTNETLHVMIREAFDEARVALVPGEVETGIAFTRLPFDHILFTGSTGVGRHVMRAASDNLTPVTLELGGKSPTIIGHDTPMAMAAERICFGKTMNAGQTCVAPDYVLCPRDRQEEFVDHMRTAFRRMFPRLADNPDYTSIIDDRQFERLQNLLHDARTKEAHLVELNEPGETLPHDKRRMPLTLVMDVQDDMLVLQEEIFGPILPIIPYDHLDEALDYINARPRPLAMNVFLDDAGDRDKILKNTHSGGVCFNDCVFQVAVDDLPFGGTGHSGMGNYHGHEGFITFSHARAVFSRPRLNTAKLLYPPYGSKLQHWLLKLFVR